ncbi:MAG: hypothetical protein K2Y71_29200 [Xanthobacteraceae bacterium]|nr:hypothetical protein [Xanthobacteraceae bacterium]
MADTPPDPRSRFFEESKVAVDRHRQRSWEYEKEAIALVNNGLRALTYLNGGGLVAMPAAVALFQTDIQKTKEALLTAALLFVAGLLLVLLTNAASFFVMARRAESETFRESQQMFLLAAAHFAGDDKTRAGYVQQAAEQESTANRQLERSNWYRRAGILTFWLAFGCFVAGCYYGSKAVLAP